MTALCFQSTRHERVFLTYRLLSGTTLLLVTSHDVRQCLDFYSQ